MKDIPCDMCAQAASIFYTQIINGQVQKVNLCEECSKKKEGVTDPTGFALAELLLGMAENKSAPSSQPAASSHNLASEDMICETCGFSQADFKKTGRLGCSQCYDLLRNDVYAVLKNIHRGDRHVGKIPSRHFRELVADQVNQLQEDLQRAISEERFEEAARLRDEIGRLATTDTAGK
jgi:protein arginine kinase activator